MGRKASSARALGAILVMGGIVIAGCDGLPFLTSRKNAAKTAATQQAQSDADKLSAKSQQQADRLKRAMAQANLSGDEDGPPEVHWIDLHADAHHAAKSPAVQGNTPASISQTSSLDGQHPGDAAHPPKPANGVADLGQSERRRLVSQLLDAIRAGTDPAIAKAVALTGLTMIEPGGNLDPTTVPGLTDSQRQQMRQFCALVSLLSQKLVSDGRMPDSSDLESQLEGLDGSQPVRVRAVHLCRRVSGYGVYDTFDSNTFLAGREQPMIIYVELDQFRSVKGPDDLYHVKLAQEVTLYNETDGLAVWHQPSVDIVDDSRNRRHDFFLVQLVKLPANLTVGKYRLNVRVTDSADSSLDELKVPIQIVADESLVSMSPSH